ncbi:MAG: ATP-binding cassette domain-containing protein [Planctomycetaceae bacterium]
MPLPHRKDSPPLLEARGLTRRDHTTGAALLGDISLRLDRGDRVALIGPTGSGKTLLLRALAGLDPLDGGEVAFRGTLVPPSQMPAFRRQVIYLHQHPALFDGTVADNLARPFQLDSHAGRQLDTAWLRQALRGYGREDTFLERSVTRLSGGERQVVALLRAVQLQPAVLLLDEPTASIDEAAGRYVESLVAEWANADPERAWLWVTHDLSQAARVSGHVWRMERGQLTQSA